MKNKLLSRVTILAAALTVGAAPLWAQIGPRSEPGRTGPSAPGAIDTPPGSVGTTTSNEDVRRLQQALKDKGLDPGPINGVMGPKTQEAVRAFQQRQGLNATGRLDPQTQSALGLGIGAPGSPQPGIQSPGSGGPSSGTSVEPAVPRDPSVRPGEPLPPANQRPSPSGGAGGPGGAGGR